MNEQDYEGNIKILDAHLTELFEELNHVDLDDKKKRKEIFKEVERIQALKAAEQKCLNELRESKARIRESDERIHETQTRVQETHQRIRESEQRVRESEQNVYESEMHIQDETREHLVPKWALTAGMMGIGLGLSVTILVLESKGVVVSSTENNVLKSFPWFKAI